MKNFRDEKFYYLLIARESFCIIALLILAIFESKFKIPYFSNSEFFKTYGSLIIMIFNIFYISANIIYVIFKLYQTDYILMRLYEKYIILFQILIFFTLCLMNSSLIAGPILLLIIFIFDYILYREYMEKLTTLSYESADNIPTSINLMYIKKRIPIGEDKYIEPGEVVNILDIVDSGKEDSDNSEKRKITYKIQRYNGTVLDISNKYI